MPEFNPFFKPGRCSWGLKWPTFSTIFYVLVGAYAYKYIYIYIYIYIDKTHEKKTYIHTVDRQKIKPYRHLPNKTPHPKLQCWTKLYLTSSAFRICFFCPPVPSAQPKDNIKIFGAWGLTTIQQGFDFIVHLQYVNKFKKYIYIYIYK